MRLLTEPSLLLMSRNRASRRARALLWLLSCGAVASSPAAGLDLNAPAVAAASQTIRAAALRSHVVFLADDLLEGRGTATRGHEIAARYVASQLALAGLEPAAAGEWLQPVQLRRSELDRDGSRIEIVRPNGERTTLVAGHDFVMGGGLQAASEIAAPIVFAGFGITAPELGYDDYAGLDVRGKVVAFRGGGPTALTSEARAYYSERKQEMALAHGAAGTLFLAPPGEDAQGSWEGVARSLAAAPTFYWLDGAEPRGGLPQLQATAWLSPAGSQALFASPEEFAGAMAKPSPGVLPLRLHVVKRSRIADLPSPNVVGLLRGSDPRLRDEYVVFSAHLDHLGIGEPIGGDAIYNGAVDDASGIAALLELARAFAALPERPRRSLLFVAFTGEEPGNLGSEAFVRHPPVPLPRIVADLNIDGAPVWPFDSLIPRGAEHSTLASVVAAAAAIDGAAVIEDPFPGRMLFLGSDQYAFAKAGVPALIVGTRGSGEARAQALRWVQTRYHAPSDDLSQPLDFTAAERFARILFRIGYGVAQEDERPRWNRGDFYGERFGTEATKGR
jgi:hypothetical protein